MKEQSGAGRRHRSRAAASRHDHIGAPGDHQLPTRKMAAVHSPGDQLPTGRYAPMQLYVLLPVQCLGLRKGEGQSALWTGPLRSTAAGVGLIEGKVPGKCPYVR